jgi:2-amino-4-hydroxy-6-hydroxymethyldihydropteridine diphosphokinase
MSQVFVALGSNLSPGRHLDCALTELRRIFGEVSTSDRYRSHAVGSAGAPFINMTAGFNTELPVRELIGRLKAIEAHCGRSHGAAGVEIDLDLLLYGQLVSAEPGAELPRPELLERAYMLGPLAELAPQLHHPVRGRTIGDLWAGFDKSRHALERIPP